MCTHGEKDKVMSEMSEKLTLCRTLEPCLLGLSSAAYNFINPNSAFFFHKRCDYIQSRVVLEIHNL